MPDEAGAKYIAMTAGNSKEEHYKAGVVMIPRACTPWTIRCLEMDGKQKLLREDCRCPANLSDAY